MDIPYIDNRSKRDIIEYMKKISKTYTPEWNFNESDPDVGTGLALIYADMYYETVKRFNKSAQKYMYEFFNLIGVEMLPATVSKGYVSFQLSSSRLQEAVEVKSGTQLVANSQGQQVLFQTLDDVLVSNSRIQSVYMTNGNMDVISKVYGFEENKDVNKDITVNLFDILNYDNSQSHSVYLYHKSVFNIEGNAFVGINFINMEYDPESANVQFEKCLSSGLIKFQYYTAEGYVDFAKVYTIDNKLIGIKLDSQPKFEVVNSDEEYSVRIVSTAKDLFKNKVFKRLECFSQSKDIIPFNVFSNDIECNTNQCYPFGEKPIIYDEFYIACKDAFSKEGATIEVSFYVDFKSFPIQDAPVETAPLEYKLIMKRSQFKPEEEFEISIDNVVWEYFNGNGWARLFTNDKYSDVFNPKGGRKTKTISFICPSDMHTININAKECYYIRAKILKINNAFKTKGMYITPIVSEIAIKYHYENYALPSGVVCNNNLQEDTYNGREFNSKGSAIQPFKYLTNSYSEMYLGFDIPPEYGPVKFLFCMKDDLNFDTVKLRWSYLTSDGWKTLTMFDATESFKKTGVVTLIGNDDFKRETFFKDNLYWVKVSDFQDGYSNVKNNLYPTIEEVHNNIAEVINVVDVPQEIFSVEPFEEDKVCTLVNGMVYSIEVWVDEISELTNNEIAELDSKGLLDITNDIFGVPTNIWVKWSETDNLKLSTPNDRHYKVDRNIGTVTFGDNVHGKIPPYKGGDTIKVKYSIGGGKVGNVQKDKINQINQTLGFVSNVYNPLITYGGTDVECVDTAIKRTSSTFRTRNRAVTAFDYEALVYEAERSILKVKFIPHILPDGSKAFGNMVIVILIENYAQDKSYFTMVKDRVIDYISEKMSTNIYQAGGLSVIEPIYVYYNIKVEVCTNDLKNVFDVKSNIENSLDSFFNIMTGNFNGKGWDIGVLPNTLQILNVLKGVSGVSFVKNIVVTPYIRVNSQIVEVDISSMKGREFALGFNGENNIIITVE